jgi:hypothetical protein
MLTISCAAFRLHSLNMDVLAKQHRLSYRAESRDFTILQRVISMGMFFKPVVAGVFNYCKGFRWNRLYAGRRLGRATANLFYNRMKYVESCIATGQLSGGEMVPLWLSDRGLESIDSHMAYSETVEVLRTLAPWANALMDPTTAKEKLPT